MRRRELIIPALVGAAGLAALGSREAKADTLFTSYPFAATGGTANRTMPDRLADIINVKDYGAVGNGVADDYPGVQAAFDAAFGSAASPHGLANATLNRPVFFPNGNYIFSSGTPTLTRVVGGHIYGAGAAATKLSGTGPVIKINGAANLVFERFSLTGGNGTGFASLDLDWDNTAGGDGLHSNVFRELLVDNFDIGILIAKSGNDGADNLFELCTFSGHPSTSGIEARGAGALNNIAINCAPSSCTNGFYCSGGSIHVFESSTNSNTYDLRVDSGFPCCMIGGRTETAVGGTMVKLSSGLVTVRGMLQANTGASGTLANVTGGKLSMDGCNSPNPITGNAGSIYLRASNFTSGSLLSGYSGTVAQNI